MLFQRYSLYIMKNLAWSALFVSLSLTSIIWLVQALRFVEFIINRGVSFLHFLHLTVLLLPSLFLIVMPFALVVAVLFVYNKLTADSEMVVLKSAGLSRWQLARPAIQLAALITLVSYMVAFWLLPITYHKFKDMQAFLRDNYASLLLQEQVFNTPVEGLTVFIRERKGDDTLRGILVHDNRIENHPITMMAQEGRLFQTEKGPRFILVNGNRQEVRNGRLSLLSFRNYTLDLGFYTGAAETRVPDPEELYLSELFDTSWQPEKKRAQYRSEAHHRLTWSLYNMGLTMLVLAMLLSGDFNRRGQMRRIIAALIVAFALIAAEIGSLNLANKQPYAIILLYVLSLGAIAAGLVILLRGTRFTPPPPYLEADILERGGRV